MHLLRRAHQSRKAHKGAVSRAIPLRHARQGLRRAAAAVAVANQAEAAAIVDPNRLVLSIKSQATQRFFSADWEHLAAENKKSGGKPSVALSAF